jgi:imidazolonepropionase-like amidohydrolase
MKKWILSAFAGLAFGSAFAQQTFPVNGVHDPRENDFALEHANIQVDYQTLITDATILIKEGRIVDVGKNISVPKGTVEIDLKGKFIYPAFIDLYSTYGMPQSDNAPTGRRRRRDNGPQMESDKTGAYEWNQAINSDVNAYADFSTSSKDAEGLRKAGFGAVLTSAHDGIMQGSAALVFTGDDAVNEMVANNRAANFLSFDKGTSTQDYPASLMGCIALIRQTYYDAQWYKNGGNKEEYNISLDAVNNNSSLPQIFLSSNWQNDLRANKIANEFSLKYIIRGNGDEYQRIADLKATGDAFIIPLNFPKAYDVSDPYEAQLVSLADMLNWELAPTNPGVLEKNGVDFALTMQGLDDAGAFVKNIQKAMKYGLSFKQVLKSLTYTPAQMIGEGDDLGSLAKGKFANFIITSDTIFKKNTIIYQTWVKGEPYVVNSYDFYDIRGEYSFNANNLPNKIEVGGTIGDPDMNVMINDTTKIKADFSTSDHLISFSFNFPKDSDKLIYRLSGVIQGNSWSGSGQDPKGNWFSWTATMTGPYVAKTKKTDVPKSMALGKVLYPFNGHGSDTLPKAETVLLKNGTVWTGETPNEIKNGDVLIQNGKIVAVGQNISAPAGAKVIDCSGEYITSGIVDEHSHIAISGDVNEGTNAVTSEVRIGDVVNSQDISIYRSLSGGVTSAHLLHGSANPIGGQTQLVKFRWGMTGDEMKFQGWPGFIKFALGENVKQSNWGDQFQVRFPQTRMGVEQVYYDNFIRAREYDKAWNDYNALPANQRLGVVAPRRDLQLDALAEILDGKRFITCHSYVQSEINMLMHVADSMHFHFNTFTHILEGYKVADKMKARGIYGSTFADWWDYKYEVIEAIPYNAYILTKMGIPTAINSDDDEMQRRLNQEAAKSMKYGGLTEEEAWKLCTLNPATMLHVADKTGSLKVGKDADVVVWTADPLTIYAKADRTFVDGVCYFSLADDAKKDAFIQSEKSRLIQKMLQAKANGEPTQKVSASNGTTEVTEGDEQ